jgi:carboxyl-terminal processing protease
MNRTASIRLGIFFSAIAVTTGVFFTPAPRPAFSATVTADLDTLAERGRFDELLSKLTTANASPQDDAVRSLIDDLKRYQKNDAQRTQQRREAFDEAMVELEEFAQNNESEKALIAAVKAHGLADDPQALLQDPRVVGLINETRDKAELAKTDDNWLEALALYRALDLLFEASNAYQEDVNQAAKHIRVLQLYAPNQLEQLYEARAKNRGDKDSAASVVKLETENWESRLKGVRESMLRQTVYYAARKHVAKQGIAPLIQGAVDALIVMLDTKGLEESLPTFNNKADVARFRDYLARLSASLQEPGKKVTVREASTIIDRVLKTNKQTLKLPEEVIVHEMTEGLTGTLDDFSSVIWPQERESFSRSTQGNFSGIGVQISRRDGRLLVVSPLENTPAMRAGLKAGDIIAQVEGVNTDTWSLNRAVQEITGPRGTQVKLSIDRAGETELIDYAITRDKIEIESIRGWTHKPEGGWDYWIDPDNRIGYIRLSQFIPQTADDLDAAVELMQKDGPINGLILDLRFNPGGLLSSAIDICDRFIIEGPLVSTVDGNGNHSIATKAHRLRTYPNFPMTVLINQGSASASEIVSGALQDYQRATIIGSRSFGKGSVQDLFPLTGNGAAYLKLTTQYYMLPLKRIIHRKPNATEWGIEPDLEVNMTARQVADALQLRQEADIIRDAGSPILADETKPWATEQFQVPDGIRRVISNTPATASAQTDPPVIEQAVPATEEPQEDLADGQVVTEDTPEKVMVEIRQPTPALLLELGLDSQLETALLVLKTRLASEHFKMAQVPDPAPASP